jgi:hypothetical protein
MNNVPSVLFKYPVVYLVFAVLTTLIFWGASRLVNTLSYVLLPFVFLFAYGFISIYTHKVQQNKILHSM